MSMLLTTTFTTMLEIFFVGVIVGIVSGLVLAWSILRNSRKGDA